MALDFGGGLFPQQGLLQEQGLLSERWQQEGVDLISVSHTWTNAGASRADVCYTVTAGKKFFLKAFEMSGGAGQTTYLADSDEAANFRFLHTVNTESYSYTFNVPVEYNTEINCINNNTTGVITLIGWEEDD